MANEKNLIPYTKGSRSKEEAEKNGAKGGVASGEARRRRRTMKQMASFVLALQPTLPPKVLATIANMGVDTASEDVNMLMMTILAVAQKAIKGDLKAAQLLLEISGEAVTSYDQTDKGRLKLERERLKFEQRVKNDEPVQPDDGFIEALNGMAGGGDGIEPDSPDTPEP